MNKKGEIKNIKVSYDKVLNIWQIKINKKVTSNLHERNERFIKYHLYGVRLWADKIKVIARDKSRNKAEYYI